MEDRKNRIIDNYVIKQYGQVKSGVEFGVSGKEVKKILQENDVQLRNFNEANSFDNNDVYFQTQSSSMAWLLGFLVSGIGAIAKKSNLIRIVLSRTDREILEKIKDEVGIEAPIKDFTNSKGYECSQLYWTSAQHKKDIIRLLSDLPCNVLERKYWIDYIRGLFDGTGRVSYLHNNQPHRISSLRWEVLSTNKELLEFVSDFLREEYGITHMRIQREKKIGLNFVLTYSTKATRKIYEFLYTPNALFLARKKKKFEEVLLQKENFLSRDCHSSAQE